MSVPAGALWIEMRYAVIKMIRPFKSVPARALWIEIPTPYTARGVPITDRQVSVHTDTVN